MNSSNQAYPKQLELAGVKPQAKDYLKQIEKGIQLIEQGFQDMRNETWECRVLPCIPVPATRILMRQHGRLITLSNGQACIRMSSKAVYKIAQTKRSDIEAGFQKAFGYKVNVLLEH